MITSEQYKEKHSQLILDGEESVVHLFNQLEKFTTDSIDVKRKELIMDHGDTEPLIVSSMGQPYSLFSITTTKYDDETIPIFICKKLGTEEKTEMSIYDFDFFTELLFEIIILLEQAVKASEQK